MTKKDIKKEIKKEWLEIGREYKDCNWKEYGTEPEEAEVYNRGWYDAYSKVLSMLE